MISIMTNTAAMTGLKTLNLTNLDLFKSLERLSTGRRINRGADDPSGLIAAERFNAEQVTIEKQLQMMERESAYLAAKDGAHEAISDKMVELDGLVVQAANSAGLTEGERGAIQMEIDSIVKSIDFAADTTYFNGEKLLEGVSSRTLGRASVTIPGEGGASETISYSLADIMSGGQLDLKSGRLEFTQAAVKAAGSSVSFTRGAIGTRMTDIDSESRELQVRLEGVAASKSSIMDTDFARETANLVRTQVLQQAALYTTQMAIGQNANIALALLG